MHDLLFANGRALSAEAYGRWAAGLGLDAGRFEEDFASPSVDDQVARDLAAGEKLGVTGTPTAFINGVRLVGSVPYEAVDELVRLGLGRAAVLLRQGVAPEKIYETLLRQEAPAAGRPPR
ncbi:MAG: DsbA family protein, partial [Deltaproteobacteria bacterium]|nr:DsbA family protein [Deltaproteobacteria bacterium]